LFNHKDFASEIIEKPWEIWSCY